MRRVGFLQPRITSVCTLNKSRFIFVSFLLSVTYFYLLLYSYRELPHHLITLNDTHTLGRTPLDEGSAHYRDLYLTTQNTHNRHTFTLAAGFELPIPARERQQTHTLDSMDTEIGIVRFRLSLILGSQTNELRPGNKCHSLRRVAKNTSCGNAITMTRQIFGECT